MICYVDGGYNNDGSGVSNHTGYGSYKIYQPSGENTVRFVLSNAASNNEAEYQSLIKLLTDIQDYPSKEIDIYMDSSLVVNQVNDKWAVRASNLLPFYKQAKKLFQSRMRLIWVDRKNLVRELGH